MRYRSAQAARAIVAITFVALVSAACARGTTVSQAPSALAEPDSVYDGRVQVAPDATIPPGEIEGVVRTEDSGTPLGKATVSATSLDTRLTMQVSTDEQGRFHFSGLPLGRLVLQAHLIGYTRVLDTLDLRSGVSVILGLHVGAVTLCACVVTLPVPAVTVRIRDESTGRAPEVPVTLRLRDRKFIADTTSKPVPANADSVLELSLTPCRTGNYTVEVTAPGYKNWRTTGVKAAAIDCVNFVRLTIPVRLLPTSK